MILCENNDCATEWFHLGCIDEKISDGDKWFCRDCKKGRGKGRKPKP